jgi:hypothetical protein
MVLLFEGHRLCLRPARVQEDYHSVDLAQQVPTSQGNGDNHREI